MTNSIKFYYNGIRVNGDKKLIKCFYSLDNSASIDGESVSISARDYDNLPRDMFEVTNDTDLYTDYFDSDHATLTPAHPLYKYARYAAECAEIRMLKSHIEYLKKNIETRPAFYRTESYKNELMDTAERLEKLEQHKNPGQPTAADLEAVRALVLEQENRRKAEEQAEQQRQREEFITKRINGRKYIEDVAEQHPIKAGEPIVTILWSESAAFAAFEDGMLDLSVEAADIILKHFDEERHAENVKNDGGGYDKTKFEITYTDESGKICYYEDRYDLGDNYGGLIEFIRPYTAPLAEYLERFISKPEPVQIVKVELAPWVKEATEQRRKKAENELKAMLYMIEQLTAEQLQAAIRLVPSPDVAMPFLQALLKKDPKVAADMVDYLKERFK